MPRLFLPGRLSRGGGQGVLGVIPAWLANIQALEALNFSLAMAITVGNYSGLMGMT